MKLISETFVASLRGNMVEWGFAFREILDDGHPSPDTLFDIVLEKRSAEGLLPSDIQESHAKFQWVADAIVEVSYGRG